MAALVVAMAVAGLSTGVLPTSASFANRNPATVPTVRRSPGLAEQPLTTMASRLWFFGGFGATGDKTDMYYYDTALSNWVLQSQSGTPNGRDRHGLAWSPLSSRLVMFGGVRQQGFNFVVTDEVQVFNPATGAWALFTSSATKPTARADVAMYWVSSQNRFLVFGGIGGTATASPRYNELWWLSIDTATSTATWTLATPAGTAPSGRNAACTGFDTVRQRLYLFGGEATGAAPLGGTFQYDVATDTWTADSPTGMIPSNRSFAACGYDMANSVLALYGGYDGAAMVGDTYAYDPSGKQWGLYSPTPAPGNLADAAATYSTTLGGMLIFGGQTASTSYVNATWLLTYAGGAALFPPVARAGPDQAVAASSQVTVDASATTDPDSTVLTYAWSQTSGPAVSLSTPGSVSTTFTAPSALSASIIVLQVRVTDPEGNSSSDSVLIDVAPNVPPVADAGPNQSVGESVGVTLSGSASNPEPQTISYLWMQTAGPVIALSSGTAANPTFTSPFVSAVTTLSFSLVVSDGTASSAADLVDVVVQNDVPEPDAGSGDDGGVPDAGAAFDGGTADAGFEDGGFADGGFADGGFADGGFADGGFADGGFADGGFADGGVVDEEDGGAGDGGSQAARAYGVGCGCSASPANALLLTVLAFVARGLRRRRVRP